MARGNRHHDLQPGLPNARRVAPRWQAAWAALYDDARPVLSSEEALAERERMHREFDAERNGQGVLKLRGAA